MYATSYQASRGLKCDGEILSHTFQSNGFVAGASDDGQLTVNVAGAQSAGTAGFATPAQITGTEYGASFIATCSQTLRGISIYTNVTTGQTTARFRFYTGAGAVPGSLIYDTGDGPASNIINLQKSNVVPVSAAGGQFNTFVFPPFTIAFFTGLSNPPELINGQVYTWTVAFGGFAAGGSGQIGTGSAAVSSPAIVVGTGALVPYFEVDAYGSFASGVLCNGLDMYPGSRVNCSGGISGCFASANTGTATATNTAATPVVVKFDNTGGLPVVASSAGIQYNAATSTFTISVLGQYMITWNAGLSAAIAAANGVHSYWNYTSSGTTVALGHGYATPLAQAVGATAVIRCGPGDTLVPVFITLGATDYTTVAANSYATVAQIL